MVSMLSPGNSPSLRRSQSTANRVIFGYSSITKSMMCLNSNIQVMFGKKYHVKLNIGGGEILIQNAAMDATTQFEDINHSAKA